MRWAFDTYPRARNEAFSVREVGGLVLATTRFVVEDRASSVITTDKYTLFDGVGGRLRRVSTYSTETAALAAASRRSVLTPREREVFQLVAQGRTVQGIADVLFLSPATVRTHVRNGIARVGATNKVHAVSLALKRGEISA
jgi:DNA-binding CsgD family transcriptional regulator